MTTRLCSVEGCHQTHSSFGYCNRHYKQFKRHGRIIPDIELTGGKLLINVTSGTFRRDKISTMKQEAAEARKRGERCSVIAKRLGVSEQTVSVWTRGLGLGRAKSGSYNVGASKYIGSHTPKPLTEDEYWKRIRVIPPDTRDLTGKLLGDPVPARSALAQRERHD